MHLRLVTYNIHKGIGGRDRRYQPERIIETLAHLTADVAFLQEVDEDVPRSRHHMQAELLAAGLGFTHIAFQRNVTLKKGWYGNAILSRFPLSEIESYDLTVRFKKRRQALFARCKVPVGEHTRSLIMTNLHLGLAGPERVYQLRKFLQHHLVADAQRQTPIVVGGDFNDVWGSLGRRVLEPAGFHLAGGMMRTFPAILPLRPLDRVYFRGPLAVHHTFACRTKVAHQASDHLPLVAEFLWKE
jgi:endonuclease/exonuclease/phosphatase family metal-dependent hydrolase